MTEPLPEQPAWYKLLRERASAPDSEPAVVGVPDGEPVVIANPTAYAASALERECRELAEMAPDTGRNHQLNAAAFSLGRLIDAELPLDEEIVTEQLLAACDTNGLLAEDGTHACLMSIRSGLRSAAKNPLLWTPPVTPPQATPVDLPAGLAVPTAPIDALVDAEAQRQRVARAARRIVDGEDAARLWVPPPPGYTWGEFVAIEFPEQPWLIADVAPLGANITLTAPYKTGKTTVLGELVAALAGGGKFLKRFDVAATKDIGGVALWDYEMNPRQHQAWSRALDRHVVDRERVHLRHLRGTRLKISTEAGTAEAIQWLKERNIGVWLVDPFARAYLGDENDNSAVTVWTDLIDIIKTEAGVHTFVMPVHTGRREAEPGTERARGATRLDDWPDVRWLISKEMSEAATRYFFQANGRDVELDSIGYQMDDDRRLDGRLPGREEAALNATVSMLLSILPAVASGREGLSKTAIREAFGWSGATANKHLDRARKAGRITEAAGKWFSNAATGVNL